MILKYKVPKDKRLLYCKEKYVYCKIISLKKAENIDRMYYKVEMINLGNKESVFMWEDLKDLNIIDYIKLQFIK